MIMAYDPFPARRLSVLGATGSVGTAALDVAQRAGCEVLALAAGSDVDGMLRLCSRLKPRLVALASEDAGRRLAERVEAEDLGCEVGWGHEGMERVATCEADTVLAAISGVAGVRPTMAATCAGKRILLANKEALVTAGRHMLEAASVSGAELIPVDSEHGALLELLHYTRDRRERVSGVWLTASGGPFHESDVNLAGVSPQMASAHPVWEMGMKISVDSATLMNKGLEVIEANLLFGFEPESIRVVVHPQGIVHALVDLEDGGSIAHCAPPDMRHAIARALAWPASHGLDYGPLDWREVGTLEFKEPDTTRFPCLRLANEALRAGGSAPAILNAANEVAVEAFCDRGKIAFTDIPPIVEETLSEVDGEDSSLEDMVAADRAAREHASEMVLRMAR